MFRLKLFALFVLLLPLLGCTPVTLFGGAAGAGATLSKEKTVGSSVDDYNIWTKIKAAFLAHHKEVENILTNISVEVSEGRVLLTGYVNTQEERLLILKLVWEQNGVREVINEIKLKGENGNDSIGQYGSDSWITTQVKSKMLLNDKVRSINYNIETINGNVYILGIARNHDEYEAIKNIVETTKNVQRFVGYIKIKDEEKIIQQDNIQVSESKEEEKVLSRKNSIEEEKHQEETNPKSSTTDTKDSSKTGDDDEIEIEYVDSEEDVQ